MFTRLGYYNNEDNSVTSRLIYGDEIEPTIYELLGIPCITQIWLRDARTDVVIWIWERN